MRRAEVNSSDFFPTQSTHPISPIAFMMVLIMAISSILMRL
jgi:hypothetical protein